MSADSSGPAPTKSPPSGSKSTSAKKSKASPESSGDGSHDAPGNNRDGYVVVARRYRPQRFEDLVGQKQVATALANAIETNRVGHAYLFTGARGVGKTSTARILAKALNCRQGPTATPCDQCDICQAIVSGEDVDVLEIDGASNRGIDEIRQLRSNVNVRPSRSRFKIYIIDEVHMLTTPAFNALLKTLEEPPEHVKFVFCTTDPEKIPITVLSRCQTFDFAPVEADAIVERLRQIVQAEGVEATDEALQAIGRRAAGSMRDSQSLLEQLLAFCGNKISLDDVHQMLGTAQSGRLIELANQLQQRNAAGALAQLDAAVAEGVDLGQMLEQLLGHFRDVMAALVGCTPDLLRFTPADQHEALTAAGREWGLETILAVTQILDQSLARLRQTTQLRTLVEVAVVRICMLENLDSISDLLHQLDSGTSPPRPTTGSSSGPSRPAAATDQRAGGQAASNGGAGSAPSSSNPKLTSEADIVPDSPSAPSANSDDSAPPSQKKKSPNSRRRG